MLDGGRSHPRSNSEQRRAMARILWRRASTLRSRLSRSRRSLSATVIAPVMVSPVRRASSPANLQVSSFLMLRLNGPPLG